MHNIFGEVVGTAMSTDNQHASAEEPADQTQSEAKNVSRRKALGRFVGYTAPAMLAMLMSAKAAAASVPS
jgi:hypothetical protein